MAGSAGALLAVIPFDRTTLVARKTRVSAFK
jgi:hypothetical protein